MVTSAQIFEVLWRQVGTNHEVQNDNLGESARITRPLPTMMDL